MDISASAINAYQIGPSGAMTLARFSEKPEFSKPPPTGDEKLLREKFQEFVAGTFFRMWMNALRKSQANNTLVNGGRAEEIFTAQLDQTLSERFAQSHGDALVGHMFDEWLDRLHSEPIEHPESDAFVDQRHKLGRAPL